MKRVQSAAHPEEAVRHRQPSLWQTMYPEYPAINCQLADFRNIPSRLSVSGSSVKEHRQLHRSTVSAQLPHLRPGQRCPLAQGFRPIPVTVPVITGPACASRTDDRSPLNPVGPDTPETPSSHSAQAAAHPGPKLGGQNPPLISTDSLGTTGGPGGYSLTAAEK